MGAAVCTRDCFHCPFPDCIVDEMDHEERKAHRDMEKDLMTDPEKKRIAAKRKAYREANRDRFAELGGRIRQARKAHGYTLHDLGRLFRVSMQLVGHWETGRARPPVDKLVEIFPELQKNSALSMAQMAQKEGYHERSD